LGCPSTFEIGAGYGTVVKRIRQLWASLRRGRDGQLRSENGGAPRFVLGVDLDGVVADFYGAMRPIVAEWLGVPTECLSLESYRYGLKEWGVRDNKHYERIHRFAVTQRSLFLDMPPIPGAGPALRRLSDDGVHIRLITHRLFIPHFHQEAVRQTVQWLDNHGIPYWDLCFLKDKVDVGADLYIEDTPHIVKALRSAGKRVIVFANPTNEELGGDDRVESWEAAEQRVRACARQLAVPTGTQLTGGSANDPEFHEPGTDL
jgi:5'(3')-deoxyribonucleotidase